MKIAILGAGYVGLVTGACLADFGNTVTCIDKDLVRMEKLRAGEIPIYEPGLDTLVADAVSAGRLSFSGIGERAVAQADVVFIAVGTPSRRGDGEADLSYIFEAAEEIAGWINGFTVIVTKSTVPVGTGDRVAEIIAEKRPDADFSVVSNPEFLREGAAIKDFKEADRIVIGSEDDRAEALMRELYRPVTSGGAPLIVVSRRTSELIKYAANAFLAMKITYINEMADLCEKVGADVEDLAFGMGLDNRIGARFLRAGPGYGGSCFPKDTLALTRSARNAGSPLELVETTVRVNEARKTSLALRIVDALGGDIAGKRIGLLGVTFKPDTDDVRDSPALAIAQLLLAEGADVVACDPQGLESATVVAPSLCTCATPYDAADGADALVLATEWDEFLALDLARIASCMRGSLLVDLRNVYAREQAQAAGLVYVDIGRAGRNAELSNAALRANRSA